MTRLNGNKKAMAIVAVMAMAVMVLATSVDNNLQDIWNSPQRIEAIEADINEINEMISFIEDGDRAITLLDQ